MRFALAMITALLLTVSPLSALDDDQEQLDEAVSTALMEYVERDYGRGKSVIDKGAVGAAMQKALAEMADTHADLADDEFQWNTKRKYDAARSYVLGILGMRDVTNASAWAASHEKALEANIKALDGKELVIIIDAKGGPLAKSGALAKELGVRIIKGVPKPAKARDKKALEHFQFYAALKSEGASDFIFANLLDDVDNMAVTGREVEKARKSTEVTPSPK
jgi:hypothetical protein